MSEQVTYSVSLPDTNKSITFFPDDTIENIRMRIGIVANMHPDRLRIYVQADLPEDYYSKDSRRWEILFLRMSPEGKPIRKPSLDLLTSHTDPAWTFSVSEFDHASWMLMNSKRESSFSEFRMLGTTEDNSWFFPFDNTIDPPFLPPASRVNIQNQSLFKTLHPYKIKGFKVIPHSDGMSPVTESIYYPFLRSGSPAVVSEEFSRSIARQDELLDILVSRDSPSPTRQTVLRARWKIPLVDTDFGQAPRNRFEQIFYGSSVSKNTPSVSFFGGKQEQSRHKFFSEKSSDKTPFIDLRVWQYWWAAMKPTRNKSSVLFFRGSGRFNFDRITVTSSELIVSSHRPEDSDETIESIQTNLVEWLKSIDGIAPFIEPTDIDTDRWEIQDISVALKYSKELKEADFRRFGCLRGIYEIVSQEKLLFKLLRADQIDLGLSPTELRVIQLLKDNETVSAGEIATELGISETEADVTLTSVREKYEDNPDLLDRQFSNVPTFRFTASNAIVTYAIDVKRIVHFVNILREILLNPESSDLDDVCPSRMESVETSKAETRPVTSDDDSDTGMDFLDDLLGEIAQSNTVKVIQEPATTTETKPSKKVSAKSSSKTLVNYLLTQLREFDSETFDPDDPQVLRKCDKPRQPIPLTLADMERLKATPYDPRDKGSASLLEVKDPDGVIICPEFWCTFDRIPLTGKQLGDEKKCPVCGGKVRSTDKNVEKTQDIIEYPVIQRDSSIIYPGYVKYQSKKNSRPIPCCFTTAQTTKVSLPKPETTPAAEAFYVLGESKAKLGPLRLGYIPKIVGRALGITLDYKKTIESSNRIQGGQSGFYRVGVGHASETLPTVLQFTGTIKPPVQNVDVTMRCSFFRTWRGSDEEVDESIVPSSYKYRDQIAKRIASIDKAYSNKMLTPMEELEYSAIALDCQLFVLYIANDEVQSGCFMTMGAVRSVNRAIAVIVNENGDPEYISHIARITTTPQFNANLYKSQFFPSGVIKKLIEIRNKACITDLPTIDTAISFVNSWKSLKERMPDIKVILDPYGRAQALFLPELLILPFKPTSHIPTFIGDKVHTYSDISTDELPYKGDMIDFLEEAMSFHSGYKYMHDVGNRDGLIVEMITASGLRIPVQTDEYMKNGDEIVETVRDHGEGALVWGEPDTKLQNASRAITYEAEVFEFLLFQLSHDIHYSEDYRALKMVLAKNQPTMDEVRPLLREWMDETITFSKADNPPEFVQKMRTPCSNTSCDGSMCAWDGATCKVEIKKVRASLDKAKLEKRLLSTLVSNEKIRDIVWQNKTSPFFSSILYLEMPNELILSDTDVSKRLR